MSDEDNSFQIYDWHTCDEKIDMDESDIDEDSPKICQKYIVYIFAVTKDGENTCIKVKGFKPFFWIQLPSRWQDDWTDGLFYTIQERLPKKIRDEFITRNINNAVHEKYRFRGYQWEKPRKFAKLEFRSENALRRAYYFLKEPVTINSYVQNYKFKIYEKNISPILRLIHLRDLKPSGWVTLSNAKKVRSIFTETNFVHNYEVSWKRINPVKKSSIGPIKVASYDIEADSSHGDFPVAKKDYYKLAMNMYEESVRLSKQKKRINSALLKKWLKCAFRDYYPDEKFSDELKSSIQTIILKDNNVLITKKEFEDAGLECFKELSKLSGDKNKNKEIIQDLTKILNSRFPSVKGDKVIQIGTVLFRYGQEKDTIQRHIVTLGGCSPIPGVEVVSCESVPDLIKEWVKFLNKSQPNILTGYNIFGFDFKFLWECAEEYGCLHMLESLGPLKSYNNTLKKKELFSAAMGYNYLYYFDTPGIVNIDLLKVVQREHNLSSYKLDDVSTQFINGSITKFETFDDKLIASTSSTFSLKPGDYLAIYKSSIVGKEYIGERRKIISIIENQTIELEKNSDDDFDTNSKSHYWSVGKDNVSPQDIFEMQRGTDDDRAIVAKYCVQDCELCLNLIQKLEIVTNNIGMSNVCLVPFSYLFMRGQMIKTLSLVSSECMKENYMIPELPPKDEDSKESYEGAEVLEPKPAIFLDDPVSVLDYSSLYPSSMIGTNISHDTIIRDKKYLGEEGARILREKGISFQDVSYDNYENELVGKTWKKKINAENPVVTCRYVQPGLDPATGKIDDKKRGILPRILMKLLAARKETRAMIKKEPDIFRRSVLDGLQLAYKITANSLYGGVGAEVSALYYKDIAASTTATGRMHLHLAKDYVNEHFPKAEVVYGDSVVRDTPMLLRTNGEICIITPEDLYNKFEKIGPFGNDSSEKSYVDCVNYDVWTEKGWTKVNKIMRHKVKKSIVRVVTHTSCVDVTEDHSLLDENGNPCTPNELNIGDRLMTAWPSEFNHSRNTISVNFARILGFFFGDGTCGIYNCPSGVKASWKISNKDIVKIEEYKKLCKDAIPEFEWKYYNTKNRESRMYALDFCSNNKKQFISSFREMMYHKETKSKKVPDCVLNGNRDIKKAFIIGLYDADGQKSSIGAHKEFENIGVTCQKDGTCGSSIDQKGKIASMGIYTILRSLDYNVSVNTRESKNDIYRISFSKNAFRKKQNAIKKIINKGITEQYVYDLSTENHHFHAGIGCGIVHNTDSIFVNFKPRDENGNKMSPHNALKASIEMSEEVERGIQPMLEYPHKLEYEKTFYPFILLRKKGYIGNKYEFDVNKFKQTSMGVVTKRRDNAPIVKYVYDGIISRIINDLDIEGSIQFLKDCIKKVLNGKFPMSYFIITKKLNAFYVNPDQIVHKVLADRMGERDPGNKPQSNDRIPYAYVTTKTVPKLQGDRVEHPDYIIVNNLKLDYLFYITNQIQKPVCQVYALALESLRSHGYRLSEDHFTKIEKNLRKEQKDNAIIREKIMEQKMKAVYSALFERTVKIEEGKKYGQRHISDFFGKK
tara:strand:+ start:3609 stop:8261 length:4653 start_codon:yes stop_codon:yes gene_type:complete